MTSQSKRRIGTCIATFSTLLMIGTSFLWWRSLFVADAAGHLSSINVDGRYGRREWLLLSGAGFIEVGRSTDLAVNALSESKLRAMDRNATWGWYFSPGIDNFEGDSRWELFSSGFRRLALYSRHHRIGLTEHFGRYLELPFAVPFSIFLLPPSIALVRRRRRINRDYNVTLVPV